MPQSTRTLVCPVCESEFIPYKWNQKFCTLDCQVKNNRAENAAKRQAAKIKVRECLGCPRTFEPANAQQFHCSTRCSQRLAARKRLGIVDPGLVRTCWWCGKEFTLLNALRLYCSPECSKFVKSLWNLGRYGITRDDYRNAWRRQGGLCAICKQPERTERNHLLAIDHDHETGRFRQLLCSHCNRGIGLFGDDPERLLAAAKYIERHRAVLKGTIT